MADLKKKIAEIARLEINHVFAFKFLSGKGQRSKHCLLDMAEEQIAKEVLSSICDNPSLLVKPLEWDDKSYLTRELACGVDGKYEAKISADGSKVRVQFFPTSGRVETMGIAANEEELVALKAVAQDHHNNRVLSFLNLGGQTE